MSNVTTVTVGFLINPIAGLGGKVGLHGTDDQVLHAAVARGAQPVSRDRAIRALRPLIAFKNRVKFVAVSGEMGGDVLDLLGIEYTQLPSSSFAEPYFRTSSEDTRSAVQAMFESGVELILFSGGDGTARDIYSVVGSTLPIIGIPAGVKMRSGVFALYPESAAQILIDYAIDGRAKKEYAEVLDAISTSVDQGDMGSEFFGLAMTLNSRSLLQNPKLANSDSEDGVLELAVELSKNCAPDVLYLFGPGRTTNLILNSSGFPGSLIGVDALFNGNLVGEDLSELEIVALLERYSKSFLFLGVIGGQGFLLGRGNQQLSYQVLKKIGEDNIYIVAGSKKLSGIVPNRLFVDLGENSDSTFLSGYRQVHTSPSRTTLCSLISATDYYEATA